LRIDSFCSLSKVEPSRITVINKVANKTKNILNERNSKVLPKPKCVYFIILSTYLNKCIIYNHFIYWTWLADLHFYIPIKI